MAGCLCMAASPLRMRRSYKRLMSCGLTFDLHFRKMTLVVLRGRGREMGGPSESYESGLSQRGSWPELGQRQRNAEERVDLRERRTLNRPSSLLDVWCEGGGSQAES